MIQMKFFSIISFIFSSILLSASVHATVVAVIDSNIDIKHEAYSSRVFRNYVEKLNYRDDDSNGYVDDFTGWNFQDNTNRVFSYDDRNFFFSELLFEYYDLKKKKSYDIISETELSRYDELRADERAKSERWIFTRFSHGTHVSGIAMKHLIPEGELELFPVRFFGKRLDWSNVDEDDDEDIDNSHLYNHLSSTEKLKAVVSKVKSSARTKGKKTLKAYTYLAQFADIANGSYGSSLSSVNSKAKSEYFEVFGEYPDESTLDEISREYIKTLDYYTRKALNAADNVLFTFSAGNKAADNDDIYHHPSNIRADNILAVAATLETNELAYFSNYGKKTVDIAAPGVAIRSAIPGDRYIAINGTSMAAPYVANIAGNIATILNKNKVKARPKLIKDILMGTVDYKDFLVGKVVSEGIVNDQRAYRAARLLKKYSLKTAIKIARQSVDDIKSSKLVLPVGHVIDAAPLPDPILE